MVRGKGIHGFIEAASLLKVRGVRAKYLAIGAPQPDKASSVAPEELVRQYGMENDILLLGRRDDVPNLIRLMDVVVLPSHGPEGIPRILMEAAALGKAVVATRIRGDIEVVER